ncbi:hypothetical protein KDH_28950 [Dictyobacter sp. S3.2.2.5]|uniref:DUF1326 domain-containing protein n=1 Tax=Dictyobacter halimunensis TaxID=3026934 RepID=A0ABQ6FUA5_9CHLR|nr:hypothetical protein KDH_28950 [Dictyobacter sp. S3.2.2.5]
MVLTRQQQHTLVKGAIFGARGDSCSCDPCDCNPCKCGDGLNGSLPNYPFWRVTGFYIENGMIKDIDVSQRTILSLTQPVIEGQNDRWQDVILVDADATPLQITALLNSFEQHLESVPAEVAPLPRTQRAVYRASINYDGTNSQTPTLHAVFNPDQQSLVRTSDDAAAPQARAWNYQGLMALRETFTFKG